ncbi:MAG: ParB/RepB/Spo0J family partition protein [Bacteroidales bacterium]|nr:ParB/RepB/Spo0J family partition protein [Bacteroidales bacterium]
MAIKKSGGLGRGLGSILPDIADLEPVAKKGSSAVSMVEVGLIDPNPFQPRKEFSDSELEELAQSIKQQGVITPVTLRQMPDGRYQLVAGERRLRASKRAGLKEIPAYVRTATDIQMMEMALVENIQRSDLNAIEVAQAYRQLIEECRLTHDQLSERVGKDRSTISNYLRLLGLPAESQEALATGRISMAHARVLAGVEDMERHMEILKAIEERHLSVHQTEEMAKQAKPMPKAAPKRRGDLPSMHSAAQSRLKDRLQSTVEIKRTQRGKGTLTISFNSDSDFERIIKLIEN